MKACTPQEEALLAEWLAQDPAHTEAFENAGGAWDVFGQADDDEILAAMRAHALAPPARSPDQLAADGCCRGACWQSSRRACYLRRPSAAPTKRSAMSPRHARSGRSNCPMAAL